MVLERYVVGICGWWSTGWVDEAVFFLQDGGDGAGEVRVSFTGTSKDLGQYGVSVVAV